MQLLTKNFEPAISSKVDTIKNKKDGVLREDIVTSNKEKKPVSALRSGLKPMDKLQSIQFIGAQIITQQQAIRLSEVIENITSMYVSSVRNGAQESFFSREHDMFANNMFKNGFRFNSEFILEVLSLEKVGVLKGSAALLY